MKNPLNKRLPREFRKDFGKYLVIFLLLVITIGFVSGFLVADGSMIKAYNEGINKYNTENGHFRTSEKMNDAQIQSVEENAIRIYNNFYLEQDLTNGSTMRIFANREQATIPLIILYQRLSLLHDNGQKNKNGRNRHCENAPDNLPTQAADKHQDTE